MKDFETQIYRDLPPFGTSLFHKDIQPKNQSFLEMLRFSLIPYFESYTFCFFWLILITFVFIYSLSYKAIEDKTVDQFLKISQAALFELGENYPYYIVKKYHYYRILTCMVLFRNFYHYLMVSIGLITLGSFVERVIGFKRLFVLVIFSGVIGVLTSDTINKNASLESVTPISGLIGFLIAFFLMERNRLWNYYFDEKRQMLFLLLAMIIIYWSLSANYSNINFLPQVFGMLIGFVFYFADSNDNNLVCIRLMARIILSVHIAIVVLVIFFKSNPGRVQF